MGGPVEAVLSDAVLSEAVLSLAAQHLWQGAVLLACALGVVKLRVLNAELRSWLLLAIFLLAAVAPLATLLPASFMSVRPVATVAAAALPANAGDAARGPTPAADQSTEQRVAQASAPEPGYRIPKTLSSTLLWVWWLGSLWQLARLFQGWRLARRLRRCARPAPALQTMMAGVLPPATAIAVTAVDGPLVTGFRRPAILVPRYLAETLDAATLRGVVLHEVAHIRRGDLWWSLVQRAVLAVFWWSPFLRAIGSYLDLTREMACDARAAKGCGGNVDYAGALLASAEKRFQMGKQTPVLAAGMVGRQSHLALRIDDLIDGEAGTRHRTLALSMAVASLVCFCGLVLAATPRVEVDLSWARAKPAAPAESLVAAVRVGDIAAVRRMVSEGVDVNTAVRGSGSALIQAIYRHDLAMVQALLDLGADPDRNLVGEGAPMLVAAGLGHQSIVEQLVEAGADPNLTDTDYAETPLTMAAREGHLVIVEYLVRHGAKVNQGVMADWEGRWRTPLNQASDPAVRRYLLSQGAAAQRM